MSVFMRYRRCPIVHREQIVGSTALVLKVPQSILSVYSITSSTRGVDLTCSSLTSIECLQSPLRQWIEQPLRA